MLPFDAYLHITHVATTGTAKYAALLVDNEISILSFLKETTHFPQISSVPLCPHQLPLPCLSVSCPLLLSFAYASLLFWTCCPATQSSCLPAVSGNTSQLPHSHLPWMLPAVPRRSLCFQLHLWFILHERAGCPRKTAGTKTVMYPATSLQMFIQTAKPFEIHPLQFNLQCVVVTH